ncbi:MAG: ERF family protein [Gemmatimonadales bacterium]|nr:ERF family protein [Gemmatimonadales bacterium]
MAWNDEDTTLDEGTVPMRQPVIRHSEQVDKILPAMLKAQKAIEHAHKDSENPHFRSSYASLNAYINACKKEYNDNGIVVIQGVGGTDDLVVVATQLAHVSGQWYECEMSGAPEKSGPQPKGSVITYFRRYTLSALGFMGAEDDDGESATDRPEPKPDKPKKTPAKKAPTKKTGTQEQADKEEAEMKAKGDAADSFDKAFSDLMESIGEDDADSIVKLRAHFIGLTTEKSNAFLAMTDSLNGLRSKEVKNLTARLTKGKDKLAGLCTGEWRKELRLPSLGVETCPGCDEILSAKDKEDSIVVGLDKGWCAKCRPNAVVEMMSKKGAGKDEA